MRSSSPTVPSSQRWTESSPSHAVDLLEYWKDEEGEEEGEGEGEVEEGWEVGEPTASLDRLHGDDSRSSSRRSWDTRRTSSVLSWEG
jgi:hypothetical protein